MTTAVPEPDLPHLRHRPWEDAVALLTGAFLVAWGIVVLRSVHGASGGIAGVAFLADYLGVAPVSTAFFVLNLPFYVLAVRRLGWEFGLKTFAAVTLSSAGAALLAVHVQVQMPLLLATAFSGLSLGLGFIVLFRHRGSGGGFGVVAFLLQERLGWRAGYVQLGLDLTVLGLSALVVEPRVLAASVVGAAVLNLTIATNHRPGRYVAR